MAMLYYFNAIHHVTKYFTVISQGESAVILRQAQDKSLDCASLDHPSTMLVARLGEGFRSGQGLSQVVRQAHHKSGKTANLSPAIWASSKSGNWVQILHIVLWQGRWLMGMNWQNKSN